MNFVFAGDIESGVTQKEAAKLAELATGKTVLEVGSWLGRSAVAIASTAKILHAVDWHRGDPHASHRETLSEFVSNLQRYKVRDKVVIHVGRNEDVLPLMANASFEFVFLDSFHERTAVEKDIALARRLVKPGGSMAFHDYGQNISAAGIPFGVTEAVDTFAAGNGLKLQRVDYLAFTKLP